MSECRTRLHPPGALRAFLVAATLLAAICFPPAARAADEAGPVRCKLGGYFSALREVDTSKGTFNADAWLWSICPDGEIEPLKSMEFTNAVQVAGSLDSSQDRPGGVWRQRKISGTFKADFDLRNYPFDQHELPIGLEEGTLDNTGLVYVADIPNSGVAKESVPDEWKVVGFRVKPGDHVWRTNFGDPLLEPGAQSNYAHVELIMKVARTDATTFWRIAFPVYVAAGLALITLMMQIEDGRKVLNPRVGVLAACLFAIVFNLNSSNDALGNPPYLTLVDGMNLSALVLILFTTAAGVASGVLADRGLTEKRLRRLDFMLLAVGSVSFIVANVVMVTRAMRAE